MVNRSDINLADFTLTAKNKNNNSVKSILVQTILKYT
jgi:hypothetical protein